MKKRLLFGILIVILFPIGIVLFGYVRIISDPKLSRLQDLQIQTQNLFQEYAISVNEAKQEKKIAELTPFEWDYVFSASYLTNGEQVIKRAVSSGSVSFNLSDFTIFDERLGEHDEGLVFINTREKFLLTIPIDMPLGASNLSSAEPHNACLKSAFGPASNKYFTFSICN